MRSTHFVSLPTAIKAVLFDFDLTLADSCAGVLECANYALRGLGLPEVALSAAKGTIGLPLTDVFRQLATGSEPATATEFRRLFVERADKVMTKMTQMFPEAAEVLWTLRRCGIKTGIVSTRFRYRICQVLERHGLLDALDVIVGGEDVQAVKPDPSGLLMALASLEVAAERAVYVGDHSVDAVAARAANIAFIGVLTGTTASDQLAALGAKRVLGSVGELLACLAVAPG